MKKRIISLLLTLTFILSLANLTSCSKMIREDTGAKPKGRDEDEKIEDETKYNFLILGHDRAASLTDVMLLVSFDTESHEASVLQLPRDTYIDLDGYSYHKLNGAYNYFVGEANDKGSPSASLDGCVLTAQFLSECFDIRINYCAVMDLDGFGGIVDAIGGVYMYVPFSMHYPDPGQNLYIDLNEGYQTLDGNAAEQFVRFRHDYLMGDLGREDAQKMFMTAFLEAVKNNISLSNVDSVAEAVFDCVETDMTAAEMLTFAKELLSVELENVTFMTLPGGGANGGASYVMNKASAIDIMNRFYNVYEKPVSAESFDKESHFSGEAGTEVNEIYSSPAENYPLKEYNAQDVSDEDIYIPRY